jgi:hypothetical protein
LHANAVHCHSQLITVKYTSDNSAFAIVLKSKFGLGMNNVFFFSVSVRAITASEVPSGTFVSKNRFSTMRVISPGTGTGVESEGVTMTE